MFDWGLFALELLKDRTIIAHLQSHYKDLEQWVHMSTEIGIYYKSMFLL